MGASHAKAATAGPTLRDDAEIERRVVQATTPPARLVEPLHVSANRIAARVSDGAPRGSFGGVLPSSAQALSGGGGAADAGRSSSPKSVATTATTIAGSSGGSGASAATIISDDEKKATLRRMLYFEPAPSARLAAEVTGGKTHSVDWRELGPSPLGGFQLTEKGLENTATRVVATANDLRSMINECSKVEGKSQQQADERLTGSVVQRAFDAMEQFGATTFFLASLYLGLAKVPPAYRGALPHLSLLVRFYYQHRCSPLVVERLCQRRRALFCFTNPRCLFFAVGALTTSSCAMISYRLQEKIGTKSYDQATNAALRYFQHTEGALKWLFTVYYHHPRYRAEAKAIGADDCGDALRGYATGLDVAGATKPTAPPGGRQVASRLVSAGPASASSSPPAAPATAAYVISDQTTFVDRRLRKATVSTA